MTVSRFANDRETAFATGADDYLVKPIIPDELLRMLAAAGQNGEAPTNEPVAPPVVSGPTLVRFWGVRGSIPTPGKRNLRRRRQHFLRRGARWQTNHHPRCRLRNSRGSASRS